MAATKTRISKAEAVAVITITIMEREAISREEGMTLTNKVEEAVAAIKEVGMILMQEVVEEAVAAIKEVGMIPMQEVVEEAVAEGMTLINKVEEAVAMVEGAATREEVEEVTGNTIALTSRIMAKALATATRRPCLLASITLANHANSRFGIFLVLIC